MNRRLTSTVARMLSSSERSEKDRRRRWRGLEQYCCDPTTTNNNNNYQEGNEQENDDDDFFHSYLAKHVSLMVNTIMDEQDRQWLDDVNDEERIAYLSRNISKVSTSRAKTSAENDEEDVIDIYSRGTFFNEMKEILLRCSSGSDHDDGDGGANSSFIINKVAKEVSKRHKRKEEKGKQQRRRRRSSLRRIKSMPPKTNY